MPVVEAEGRALALPNLDKVLYPATGLTSPTGSTPARVGGHRPAAPAGSLDCALDAGDPLASPSRRRT
ncbi:MAG: hypothetical protein ACRDZ9_04810 [Acidimicrobiales bacterium]